jgi:hypothetical protein
VTPIQQALCLNSKVQEALNAIQHLLPEALFRQVLQHIHASETKPYFGLKIDQHYRLWLNSSEPLELKMYPLNKAVYFLFLRHPEGIRFKYLPDFKEELAMLYQLINKNVLPKKAMETASYITDCSHPHIYQHVSKIKASIRKLIPEPIAADFYISGFNGAPKKIHMRRECLIDEVGIITL